MKIWVIQLFVYTKGGRFGPASVRTLMIIKLMVNYRSNSSIDWPSLEREMGFQINRRKQGTAYKKVPGANQTSIYGTVITLGRASGRKGYKRGRIKHTTEKKHPKYNRGKGWVTLLNCKKYILLYRTCIIFRFPKLILSNFELIAAFYSSTILSLLMILKQMRYKTACLLFVLHLLIQSISNPLFSP